MATNHYETLGISATASAAEIRSAYLAKAQRLHPDRRGGSEAEMQALNSAWTVLRDPTVRREYDRGLAPRQPLTPSGPPSPAAGGDRPGSGDEPSEPTPAIFHMVRSGPTVIVLAVLVGLFVVTAFAGRGQDDPQQRPAVDIAVGDCVTEAAGSIRRVPCDGSTTGIAVAIVGEATECVSRAGSHAVRLPTAPKYACIGPPG